MTRFARAKGSKASNEKKPGEATSWAEMKKGMLAKHPPKPSEESSLKKEQTNNSKLSAAPKKTEWAPLKTSQSLLHSSYLKRKKESESGNEGGEKNNKVLKKQNSSFNNKNQNSKDSVKLNSNNNAVNKSLKNLSEENSQGEKKDISKVGKKSKKKKKKMIGEKSLNQSNNSEIKESYSGKPEMLNQSNDEKDNSRIINRSDNFVGNKKNNKRKLNEEGQEDEVVKKNKKMSGSEDVKKVSEDWDPELNDDSEFNGKEKSGVNKKGLNKGGKNQKNMKQNTTVTEETLGSGEKVKIVKFQGFPLRQDDAERLEKLKDDMIQKGLPQEKVDAVLKLERRKAEKSWKRLRKNVCFHCRGSGHYLSNCPALTENQNTGTGICYKCGSTEHCAFDCKVVKGSNFRFAECFICKEQGHIARQCPDNPRGLYPMGGACKICGDVTHLKKDCPKVMEKKSEEILTVGVRKSEEALEGLDEEIAKKEKEIVKPKKKLSTVKF